MPALAKLLEEHQGRNEVNQELVAALWTISHKGTRKLCLGVSAKPLARPPGSPSRECVRILSSDCIRAAQKQSGLARLPEAAHARCSGHVAVWPSRQTLRARRLFVISRVG